EWRARFDDLITSTSGRRIVLSAHDFIEMPDDLDERARAMRATGADVVKLAVKTTRLSDCLPLLELGGRLARDGASVVIGMGEQGLPSRVFAGRFGSAWTYAGSDAEIGQVTATHLVGDYRFRTLTDSTDLYGVAGSPIRHSVSPAMHNAAFA